jgi:PAS domain-containing protein
MLEVELFAFLERTSDAAFTVTEQGEIRFWNESAKRLFGCPVSEALNRTCHDVLDGRGALGEQVCSGGCSVHLCAAQHRDIPDFDLEVKTSSGSRLRRGHTRQPHYVPRCRVTRRMGLQHRSRSDRWSEGAGMRTCMCTFTRRTTSCFRAQ